MKVVTSLLILKNWKNKGYDLILVFINCLIEIFYYKSIKTTMNIFSVTNLIIDIFLRNYHL